MKFDAPTLSRMQFAWVIGWHILLPAFTKGIASPKSQSGIEEIFG